MTNESLDSPVVILDNGCNPMGPSHGITVYLLVFIYMSDAYTSFLLRQAFPTPSSDAPLKLALLSPIASYSADRSKAQSVV